MSTDFIINGIDKKAHKHLFGLKEAELKAIGGRRIVVDEKPGFPCRISLEDAEIGEEVILFPYEHHATESPYQARGPIFIREKAKEAELAPNEIPQMLVHRLLSLRVYDEQGMMIDAATVPGRDLRSRILHFFKNKTTAYIQVHNASPGCFNCQIDRATTL